MHSIETFAFKRPEKCMTILHGTKATDGKKVVQNYLINDLNRMLFEHINLKK